MVKPRLTRKNMTERIGQSTGEILNVEIIRRGKSETMSLQRHGNVWTLEGKGISGTARTLAEVFVATLGIFDGKIAARKWEENSTEGGENYE